MKTVFTAMLWLLCLGGMAIAHAHDDKNAPGWRGGGSLMVSNLSRDDNIVDDGSVGFKIFGQYKFNKWVGLEAAFYDSGDFQSNATSADGKKVELVYRGLLGQALVYIPLPWESLEFLLKGGYYRFDIDSKIDSADIGTGDDDGGVFGAALSIHLTDAMHFRTGIDWYDTSDADLWSAEIGLEFLF